MSEGAVVVREVRRNLARNLGAAMWVVMASALGACLVGTAAEWFVLVGQARAATEGNFAALSMAGQVTARLPLLIGAIVAAEVIAWSTTTFAMRARRICEASFFELTLGAPKSYTKAPALVEGLGEGLLGGLVAAAVAIVVAPAITHAERAFVGFVGSSTSVTKVGGVVRTTTRTVSLHGIQLTAGRLAVIAVVVVGLGAALGLFNAFATRPRPRRHLWGDQDALWKARRPRRRWLR
jgi:hypothetical protein